MESFWCELIVHEGDFSTQKAHMLQRSGGRARGTTSRLGLGHLVGDSSPLHGLYPARLPSLFFSPWDCCNVTGGLF